MLKFIKFYASRIRTTCSINIQNQFIYEPIAFDRYINVPNSCYSIIFSVTIMGRASSRMGRQFERSDWSYGWYVLIKYGLINNTLNIIPNDDAQVEAKV